MIQTWNAIVRLKFNFIGMALVGLGMGFSVQASHAQPTFPPRSILHTLTSESSYIFEDCVGPCDCVAPIRRGPLSGTMLLRFSHADFFTVTYDVVDVELTAAPATLPIRHYSGTGTYEYGGDFALTHRLRLHLTARTEPASPVEVYDSNYVVVQGSSGRPFPGVSITTTTGIVGCSNRTLVVDAIGVAGCPGDFNADGVTSVQDIFDFLAAYFSNSPRADINANGAVTVQDVFDFLSGYFEPCP